MYFIELSEYFLWYFVVFITSIILFPLYIFQKKINDEKAEVDNLKKVIADYNILVQKLQKENENLLDNKEKFKNVSSEWERIFKKKEAEVNKLKKVIADYNSNTEQTNTHNLTEYYSKQVKEQKKQINDLKKQIINLNISLDNVRSSVNKNKNLSNKRKK